jgi:hypothetical protein
VPIAERHPRKLKTQSTAPSKLKTQYLKLKIHIAWVPLGDRHLLQNAVVIVVGAHRRGAPTQAKKLKVQPPQNSKINI